MNKFDFLKLNDYIIYVERAGNNAIKVQFPVNYDMKIPAEEMYYYYYKNELIINHNNNGIKTYKILDYEARPFITGHIILLAAKRNITPPYIYPVLDGKKTKIYNFFDAPRSEKRESELVEDLSKLIHSATLEESNNKQSLKKFIKIFQNGDLD